MTDNESRSSQMDHWLAEIAKYNSRPEVLGRLLRDMKSTLAEDGQITAPDIQPETVPSVPPRLEMAYAVLQKFRILSATTSAETASGYPSYYFALDNEEHVLAHKMLQHLLRREPGCYKIESSNFSELDAREPRPIFQLGRAILFAAEYVNRQIEGSEITNIPEGEVYGVNYTLHRLPNNIST